MNRKVPNTGQGHHCVKGNTRHSATRWLQRRCVAIAAIALPGCVGAAEDTIDCSDLLPASEASFSDIEALVLSGNKGCAASICHGSEQAEHGYRLDERSLIYDAFTTHIDIMYAQVASGSMPEDGTRWSDEDLQLVRTWYCNGGNPND